MQKTRGTLLADTIDPSALPKSAMFDTTVLVPAFRNAKRADDHICGQLLEAMVAAKRPILIAAPSAAEFWRREPNLTIPRTSLIRVVAFDQLAAEILGRKFPPDTLKSFRDQRNKPPLQYIKYDAMIVACAVRHRVDEFVSTDDNQSKLARSVGLIVKAPKDYLSRQHDLF